MLISNLGKEKFEKAYLIIKEQVFISLLTLL